MWKVLIILFMVSNLLAGRSPSICLQKEQIKIPITSAVSWGPERLKEVNILLPINCEDRSVLIPRTPEEYLMFIDLAMPLKLKSGAVQGCGSRATDNVVYTVYRYNADWIVLKHLGEHWRSSPACKVSQRGTKLFSPVECAAKYYNEYRANLMPRNPFIIGKDPAQIPTAKELDDAAINDPECRK
jgi:hypothetical protein